MAHSPVEAKRLRYANGTEVQAELFEDVPVTAECHLGTASTRIKDNNRSLCDVEPILGRKVSQSGLFLSIDDLDGDAAGRPDSFQKSPAITSLTQSHGAHGNDRLRPGALGLRGHACNHGDGPGLGRRLNFAGLLKSFTEPETSMRSSTRCQEPVLSRSATWSLTELVPTSMAA